MDSASDDDHEAMMLLRRCEMQKIVPVAREEYATSFVGKLENGLVRGVAGKSFPQQRDVVAELLQQVAQVPTPHARRTDDVMMGLGVSRQIDSLTSWHE